MNSLYIIRGDESSGKSTLCKSIVESGLIHGHQFVSKEDAVIQTTNDWRADGRIGKDEKLPYPDGRDEYYKRFRESTAGVLRHFSALLDGNFSGRNDVAAFVSSLREDVQVHSGVIITLDVDLETRRKRAALKIPNQDDLQRTDLDDRSGFVTQDITVPHGFSHHTLKNTDALRRATLERVLTIISSQGIESVAM